MSSTIRPDVLLFDRITTPLGDMHAVCDAEGHLRALEWTDCEDRLHRLLSLQYGEEGRGFKHVERALPTAIADALARYFAGELDALSMIPVMTGGTAFQQKLWGALRALPAGRTLTYALMAARLGQARAARAVGAANGANPVAVVVPCHRLLGADGALTGYAGGIERKRWLLVHEGVKVPK